MASFRTLTSSPVHSQTPFLACLPSLLLSAGIYFTLPSASDQHLFPEEQRMGSMGKAISPRRPTPSYIAPISLCECTGLPGCPQSHHGHGALTFLMMHHADCSLCTNEYLWFLQTQINYGVQLNCLWLPCSTVITDFLTWVLIICTMYEAFYLPHTRQYNIIYRNYRCLIFQVCIICYSCFMPFFQTILWEITLSSLDEKEWINYA